LFTIPNTSDAENAIQAQVDARDIDILVAAYSGTGVVNGCAVTAQVAPNMTVAVASGNIAVAGTTHSVTAGNVTITAASGANDRFDLICADSSGVLSAVAGTPAANPVFPNPNSGGTKVVLAAVRVPQSASSISGAKIVDKRVTAVLIVPAAGSIVGSQIANDTITATQIAADAIGASELAANAVGSGELADNAVDTGAIQDAAVTQIKLAAAVMQSKRIESGRATGITITGQSHTDVTINFGTAFGAAPVVNVTPDNSGDATWLGNGALHIQSVGTSNFVVRVEQSPNNSVSDARVYWMAIGT
jgi:hypothetical protein